MKQKEHGYVIDNETSNRIIKYLHLKNDEFIYSKNLGSKVLQKSDTSPIIKSYFSVYTNLPEKLCKYLHRSTQVY